MDTLDPSTIIVPADRQRRKFSGIEDMADSITRIGQINPITIRRDLTLVAGERRLRACLSLARPVRIQYTDELSPSVLMAIELEENLKRSDLTWQETCAAMLAYHNLRKSEEADWTDLKTSQALGIARSAVTDRLMVAREVAVNPVVAEAPLFSTAKGITQRVKERRAAEEISSFASGPVVQLRDLPELVIDEEAIATYEPEADPIDEGTGYILNESFNDWAEQYNGKPFNLIHCDFPYGVNADKFAQGSAASHGGYDDSPDVYWRLIDSLLNNIDRIVDPSAHLIFWFSMDYYEQTKALLSQHFRLDKRLLIWYKSDGRGILPDANRGPRWVYETAFFGTRGDRKIVRAVANVAAAPITSGRHMSEKTQSMLEHFFRMLVDENTSLLDPTAGSGSALRAAHALGAPRMLGLERDPDFAKIADDLLAAQIEEGLR